MEVINPKYLVTEIQSRLLLGGIFFVSSLLIVNIRYSNGRYD